MSRALMKTRRGRIAWGVFLVAVVAVGLAFYGTRHQPVARIPLPDGTELRLEYVTYGTEHRVAGAGRFKAWLSRQAQRWPRLNMPVYQAAYEYSSEEPQLMLCLPGSIPRRASFSPTRPG
jgi:hypothetical protein